MINIIYIIGLFVIALLVMGFVFKDYYFGSAGAIGLIIFGIYGMGNGFPYISNWGNTIFSIFSISIGLYVLIRGTLEQFYN